MTDPHHSEEHHGVGHIVPIRTTKIGFEDLKGVVNSTVRAKPEDSEDRIAERAQLTDDYGLEFLFGVVRDGVRSRGTRRGPLVSRR